MALGYGVAVGAIFRWLDTLWPSRKAAVVERLDQLTAQYHLALIERKDTQAAIYLKQIKALRKRLNITDGDI